MSNQILPDGWEALPLSQLGSFSKGKGITKADLQNDGLPCIRYGEIYTLHHHSVKRFHSFINTDVAKSSKKLKYNDLLFAGSGETLAEIGKAVGYRLKQEAFAGGDIVILSLKDQYRADYIAYYLNSLGRKQINKLGAGHSVVHIYSKDLEKVFVILPPTHIQDRIVDKLEQWDTAIEKTEALIDAKERQFGWLKSKLLLRNPNAKHWKTETLGHYIEEKKDKSTVPDLHPCLTSSRRGMFLQDEYFSKQVASKDNTGYKIMSRGDFTYRSMSDDGTFVFNKQDIVDKGLISPAYGVFTPNKHMDADFLYYFLNSSAFKRALAGEIQGGTRTALKLNALKKLDVDIPELPEQKAIANKLNTAKHEIDLLIKLADQYRTQKRGLMQKLLSGEWHIKNKEAA